MGVKAIQANLSFGWITTARCGAAGVESEVEAEYEVDDGRS